MSSNIKKIKTKLTKKLKSFNLQPVLAIILGVSLLSLINFGFVNANKYKNANNLESEQSQTVSSRSSEDPQQADQTRAEESNQPSLGQSEAEDAKLNSTNQSTKPGNQSSSGAQTTSSSASSVSPAPAQQAPTTLDVKLSVNGAYAGTLSLSPGANQCDVLSLALQKGLISSLDMRYSSAQKSMGIYKINGIGDPDSIWWVYTVNGKSPPLGCSGIKVGDGDSVNWKYIKN